jgi:histidinol-phosphatase (PHP family)
LFKHNFHTHTTYSDGKAEPEEYIKAAIEKGLRSLGFSEHAPLPFENNFSVKDVHQLNQYVTEIRGLKEKYKEQLNIYAALEADYIPGVSLGFKLLKDNFNLDYIIGSVHLVKHPDDRMWFIDGPDREVWKNGLEGLFNNNIRTAVTAYFHQVMGMIASQKPEVIGHIDKIMMHNRNDFFTEDEKWYRDLVSQCLEVAKQHNCIIEINTRGLYMKRYHSFFPGPGIMKEMAKLQIPVTISSDAHKPDEVALGVDDAAEALRAAGYEDVWIFEGNSWRSVPLA